MILGIGRANSLSRLVSEAIRRLTTASADADSRRSDRRSRRVTARCALGCGPSALDSRGEAGQQNRRPPQLVGRELRDLLSHPGFGDQRRSDLGAGGGSAARSRTDPGVYLGGVEQKATCYAVSREALFAVKPDDGIAVFETQSTGDIVPGEEPAFDGRSRHLRELHARVEVPQRSPSRTVHSSSGQLRGHQRAPGAATGHQSCALAFSVRPYPQAMCAPAPDGHGGRWRGFETDHMTVETFEARIDTAYDVVGQ